jgi:hypothetical protein
LCGGGGGDDVGAVDINVSDSSSALSFSSSLCWLCHFLSNVKYEVLQSIALVHLILVYRVFSEYVFCSGQIYVAEITKVTGQFHSCSAAPAIVEHLVCTIHASYKFITAFTSGFFTVSPIQFTFCVFTIFDVRRNGMGFISRLSHLLVPETDLSAIFFFLDTCFFSLHVTLKNLPLTTNSEILYLISRDHC